MALVVAAACAVAAAGCGGGSGVTGDPVADAATFTSNSGTMKTTFAATVTVGGRAVQMTGTGEQSLKDGSALLNAKAQGTQVRMIAVGHTIYLNTPEISKQAGKPWAKIDLQKALAGKGIDLSSLSGVQPSDASDQLSTLKAASGDNTKRVGSETIKGVKTTHYHATIDLNLLPKRVKPSQRVAAQQTVQRLIKLTGASKVPVDVWIDAKRHVRQERYVQHQSFGGRPGTMDMTIGFSDYGAPVSIHPPPSGDVKDITKLASGG
jgi:outer membrane lipoprotein-sorting protein